MTTYTSAAAAPTALPDSPMLAKDELRRYWRVGVTASMVGMGYFGFCILETPRIKFLSALGATALDFGILSAIGSSAVVFQIVAGLLVNRLERRKPYWMAACICYRLLFGLVVAAPLLFSEPRACILWIIGVQFVHDALANVSSPAWLSWVADLMPHDRMNRLWGMRMLCVTMAQVAATLASGLFLRRYEEGGRIIAGFMALASVGIACGVADILLFGLVPERHHVRDTSSRAMATVVQPLADRAYRKYLTFACCWQFASMLSTPFLTVYLVKSLQMPSHWCQAVVCSGLIGQAAGSHLIGALADRFGTRRVLRLSIVLKAFSLLPFTLIPSSPSFYWLFPCTIWVGGMLTGGIGVAMQGTMLQSSPRVNRTMYIAVAQFLAVGIGGGLAPLMSGWTIHWARGWVLRAGPYAFNPYHVMFALSLLLMIPTALLVVESPSARPADPTENPIPCTGGEGCV